MEFFFKGRTWVVKWSNNSGKYVYKEKAHLGGPWSDVAKTLENKFTHHLFRRAIEQAIEKLESVG